MALKDLSPTRDLETTDVAQPMSTSMSTPASASAPAPALRPASASASEDAFSELLRSASAVRTLPPYVTLVGRLLALTDGRSCALVTFDGQPTAAAVPARTTVDLFPDHIGQDVVLSFEAGDPARPIVMGVVRAPVSADTLKATHPSVDVQVDGQRLTLQATGELILKCGRSSITLGADGRLTLSADIIVSQAEETNRIRGGSVQLN